MTAQGHQAADGLPQRQCIATGWEFTATEAGRCTDPAHLIDVSPSAWVRIDHLGPVAQVLRDLGAWSLAGAPRRFDAEDWWYRVSFDAPAIAGDHDAIWFGLDGLATVADVWLNDELLVHSTNMYVAHAFEIGARLINGPNRLVMRFHALDTHLAAKRPRPRWRVPMVPQQQLRWFRTTLLGRTPGWSPPVAVVGPWKDVWLERRSTSPLVISGSSATVRPDGTGDWRLAGRWGAAAGQQFSIELARAGHVHRAECRVHEDGRFDCSLAIPGVQRWWPHTHGEPALYEARIRLEGPMASQAQQLPAVGFRTIEIDTGEGRFQFKVNGVTVFCRGACWTPLDPVSLRAGPVDTRHALTQMRDAGMNMVRVGGTMVYEDAAFFDACDALGVLVWQEFMFANMDYPATDDTFLASVRTEVQQQLALWRGRPSLAVVCGNSEVEQQAAMWGAPRELWSPSFFHTTLRDWVRAALPDVPYWPSSAHGGAFPHQGNVGTTSYYGVGAYLRPLEDARRADLSFATECLAFANVPSDRALTRMPGGLGLRTHHATWKERTPRDLNAGWDFEDVRDHYLADLFGVVPATLRSIDHDRYLALSRAVTGEVMASAFAEWRRPGSTCGGALVWFLRDLWAGAGWGVVDDAGVPKACFYALRRVLQPLAVFITDEGGNGLVAHLVNDQPQTFTGELVVTLYADNDAQVGRWQHTIDLPARGGKSLELAHGADGFLDISYAYRFGPPPVRIVHLQLRQADGDVRCEAFHFPAGRAFERRSDLGLSARIEGHHLVVCSRRFSQHVHVELAGHQLEDNDFHMTPGATRRIALIPDGAAGARLRGTVQALNGEETLSIEVIE